MSANLPHSDVYARLRPSTIHGIGCFAIRNIPAGTDIFPQSSGEMVWIQKDQLMGLPSEIKKLYDDFCVERDGLLGCPSNFNQMDVPWYLNHSETPNAFCDPDNDYGFYALRDIAEGEEITVNYKTYEVL